MTTIILDLVEADRLLLRYKRGEINRVEVRREMRLVGVPSELIDDAILETDDLPLSVLEANAEW